MAIPLSEDDRPNTTPRGTTEKQPSTTNSEHHNSLLFVPSKKHNAHRSGDGKNTALVFFFLTVLVYSGVMMLWDLLC